MSDPERQRTIDEICADIETLTGRLENLLRRLDSMVLKRPPGPAPWPELPNGEGIAHACICGHGIHEHNNGKGWCHLSDCDCGHFKEGIAGEASEGIGGEGAGYHPDSSEDPRD
jgi:hypothetical protein